jgi:hypothetical protein
MQQHETYRGGGSKAMDAIQHHHTPILPGVKPHAPLHTELYAGRGSSERIRRTDRRGLTVLSPPRPRAIAEEWDL